MTRRTYTHESVQRALAVHERRGVVETWSPPEPGGRRTYRVRVFGNEALELTLRETFALVVGIAADDRYRAHVKYDNDGPPIVDGTIEQTEGT